MLDNSSDCCICFAETTRQFEIAFKMIDEDKSDYIDLKEFSKVQEAVSRQRDHAVVRYIHNTMHVMFYKMVDGQKIIVRANM